MSKMNEWFKSAALSWAMTLVSIFMVIEYVRQAQVPGSDPDAMYIAIAWAFILGLSLMSGIMKYRAPK